MSTHILDEFDRNHLRNWVTKHAPIDYAQRDAVYEAMVNWLVSDDQAEYAYNAGWPKVFELSGVSSIASSVE